MARATATSDRAGETQRRLVDAAITLFTEHRYHGTSLNDVIAAAGSTKGGFYFHFGSKADFALAAIESTLSASRQEFLADNRAARPRGRPARHNSAPHQRSSRAGPSSASGSRGSCDELRDQTGVPRTALRRLRGARSASSADMLVRTRAEGTLDDGVDIPSSTRCTVAAYAGVEGLDGAEGSTAFYDQIDDHLRFTFRAIGLRSALLVSPRPLFCPQNRPTDQFSTEDSMTSLLSPPALARRSAAHPRRVVAI